MAFKKHEIKKIEEATQVLLQDLSKPISIKTLVKVVSMNEHKIQQIFQHLYGKTVTDYFKARKMAHAARLLEETEHSEKEIAALIGYRFQSFIRCFKSIYKHTPGQHRKKQLIPFIGTIQLIATYLYNFPQDFFLIICRIG